MSSLINFPLNHPVTILLLSRSLVFFSFMRTCRTVVLPGIRKVVLSSFKLRRVTRTGMHGSSAVFTCGNDASYVITGLYGMFRQFSSR